MERENLPLVQAFSKYLEIRGPQLRPTTRAQYTRFIYHCFADWLSRPLPSINRFDCEIRYNELCQRSAKKATTGGRTQALLAFRYLEAVINFAIAYWDLPQGNPVQQFRKIFKPQRSAGRTSHIPVCHLRKWYQIVQDLESTQRDMQIMWLLTGCRHSALAQAQWSEVDFEKCILSIPPEREKNKCLNRVNLTPFMIRLLRRRLHLYPGSQYIFPSANDLQKPCLHPVRAYRHVKQQLASQCKDSIVACNPHALRHTFATCAADSGLRHDEVSILLNHVKTTVTGGYIHTPFESIRPLWIKAQTHIQQALGVSDDKPRITMPLRYALAAQTAES